MSSARTACALSVATLYAGFGLFASVSSCRTQRATWSVARARSSNGASLRWNRSEILLEAVAPEPVSGLTEDDLVSALEHSCAAWNDALAGCRAPRLRFAGVRDHGAARTDGRNLVVVRADTWCPADALGTSACYDHGLQALTHVRPLSPQSLQDTDAIAEADIEINAVDFRWSRDGGSERRSLHAVLAHELGHALGLVHSCADGPSSANAPAALPPCVLAESAPRRVSIMYPDPTEPGRALVLEPGPEAVVTLCDARDR